MKTKTLLLFSLLFFVVSSTQNLSAQTVTITPKEITYKRPKPFTEYKKSFTVTRPIVKGLSPALKKKVETSIGYERNFEFDLKAEINEVGWLDEATYRVDYNKNGILALTLSMSGSGAYPSVAERSVVVNLKTGAEIIPQDVFIKLPELAVTVKKAQQEEIKKAIIDIKKENPDEENLEKLFENADFKVKTLNSYTVSDTGVTFLYDYDFPHVILALQPEGKYFFSWAQIKSFVKPGGAFGRFVR